MNLLTITVITVIFSSFSITLTNCNENVFISKDAFINQYGVIFQNMGKINFISAHHHLVLSFDSFSIINYGNRLLQIVQDSEALVKNHTHYLQNYYSIMLANIMIEFKAKFNKYKRYIDNNEYSNNVGNLDDIIESVQIHDDDDDKVKHGLHLINPYVSRVNISNGNMSRIRQALYRATLTFKAINAHYTVSNHSLYNVSRELVMSYSLTSFEFCLRDFNEEIEQILYKLDSILTTNKNSILIITPESFQKFLRVLGDHLPLIYPPSDTFMPKYYSICQSAVKKKDNILYFVIKIPITSKQYYNLFGIKYVPVPIMNLPGWSRTLYFNKEEKTFLAISTDSTVYTILKNPKDSCISSKICNPYQHIQKVSTGLEGEDCLLLAYFNRSANDKCQYIFEFNQRSKFTIVENFWIGSILTNNSYISKSCSNQMQIMNNIERGIIKIPISKNCTFSGNYYILPYLETKKKMKQSMTIPMRRRRRSVKSGSSSKRRISIRRSIRRRGNNSRRRKSNSIRRRRRMIMDNDDDNNNNTITTTTTTSTPTPITTNNNIEKKNIIKRSNSDNQMVVLEEGRDRVVNNNNNNNNIEMILYPIEIYFSNLIKSKLFSNTDITFLTSHDIKMFSILQREKEKESDASSLSFINPRINFIFFVIIFLYIIIVTFLLMSYLKISLRGSNGDCNSRLIKVSQHQQEQEQPLKTSTSGEDLNQHYPTTHSSPSPQLCLRRYHRNNSPPRQYHSPPSFPPPPPPPSPPPPLLSSSSHHYSLPPPPTPLLLQQQSSAAAPLSPMPIYEECSIYLDMSKSMNKQFNC